MKKAIGEDGIIHFEKIHRISQDAASVEVMLTELRDKVDYTEEYSHNTIDELRGNVGVLMSAAENALEDMGRPSPWGGAGFWQHRCGHPFL